MSDRVNQPVSMRTQISDAVAQAVLIRLPGKRGCSRTDIVHGNGPAGVIHFLHRSLERRAQLEVAERFTGEFGWFDVSQSAVQAALQHLQHEVSAAARFPTDEWERAVQHACSTTLDYLIGPVETLLSFSFPDNASDIAASDLRRRAGYFCDYSYMQTAVSAYVSRKGERRMSRAELSNTLQHVVQQLTADYTADDWMRLLQPVLSFVGFSDRYKGGLPVTFVEDFFASHSQPGLRAAVHAAARKAGAEMISTATLTSIVEHEMALKTDSTATGPADTESPATAPAAAEPAAPEPLWKHYSKSATPPATTEKEPDTSAQPLWKSFQDRLGAPAQGVTFRDMEKTVLGASAAERQTHVQRLFRDDATAYADVIRRLYHAPDWTAASSILAADVFRRFSIDIYSDEAVAFTNAIESRYT